MAECPLVIVKFTYVTCRHILSAIEDCWNKALCAPQLWGQDQFLWGLLRADLIICEKQFHAGFLLGSSLYGRLFPYGTQWLPNFFPQIGRKKCQTPMPTRSPVSSQTNIAPIFFSLNMWMAVSTPSWGFMVMVEPLYLSQNFRYKHRSSPCRLARLGLAEPGPETNPEHSDSFVYLILP